MSEATSTGKDKPIAVVAEKTKTSQLKQLGILALGNLLVFLLLLIPLELYFGNWFGAKLWGLFCDVNIVYSGERIYGSEKTIHYVRDSRCLRGKYDPNAIDVITVGGSTTDQRYLTEGETWQDSIARYFERNGRKLSIANAGVDGQSTIGHLWDFEYWFPKLPTQPKVYLFNIGINDIYRVTANGPYDDQVRLLKSSSSLKETIKAKSALYQLYRTVVGMREAQAMRADHERINFAETPYTEKGILGDYSFYEEYLRRDLIPRLDALVSAAKAVGSKPVFVTQRTYAWREVDNQIRGVDIPFKVGGIEFNGFDRYVMEKAQVEAILAFCLDRKVDCIEGHRAADTSEDYYDFVHNTPQGAEKIGAYIGERLLSLVN